MSSQVLVSLLIAIVLFHIVKVVAAHDNGTLHLGANNDTGEDATTNGNIPSEWALFVDVGAGNGLLGGLEAKTNVLVPTAVLLLGDDTLVVEEDCLLLLEATLVL